MENNTKPNPLPEKVVRRHAELLGELLPEFTRLVTEEGRPADAMLNMYLRSHKEMGSRDRRFLSQAVFSYFRWYGWTVKKLNLGQVEACLLGTVLDLTELPQSFDYILKQGKLPFRVQPLGDQSVEDKCSEVNKWLKNAELDVSVELNDLVLEDFSSVIDPTSVDKIIQTFQQRPPTWIRSRSDSASLTDALAENNISSKINETLPTAIAIDGGKSLNHVLAKQASQYVVQDFSSQCVGSICAPQKGGDWWDCCTGAGGKALHLMDLMEQDGKVLATDIRIPVLKEVKKRARHYGIKNIRTQVFNAINDEPFTKVFDGVVVDAPCSGWGTWGRNPDARWRSSKRDVVQCSTRQLKLLSNAKWCVKPGGTLVYSVCTLTRPETEEVVMNFLDQNTNFKLDPFANPVTGEQTNGQLQIWPWDGPGDAMFVARFIREAE